MKTTQPIHKKNKGKPIRWLSTILYSCVFVGLLFSFYAEKVNHDLSDSMIRLHIVANSDSISDQALKYRVRDAIVSYMQERMNELENKENAKAFVRGNTDKLEAVAHCVIVQEGFPETVKASFGKYPFPTKQYGNMALPAGFYDALKIEIGDAKGQNWWCVMFPPLCFVEDTTGEITEESLSILQSELSEEEMGIILTTHSESEIPVEIKFKIVELFQDSKIKLANLFRGMIKLE